MKQRENITIQYLSSLSPEERYAVIEGLSEEERATLRKERAELVTERFQGMELEPFSMLEGEGLLVEPLDALTGYSIGRRVLMVELPLTMELLEMIVRMQKERGSRPSLGDDRDIGQVLEAVKGSRVISYEYLDRIDTYSLEVKWEGPEEENPFPGFICHYLFDHPVTENGHIFMEETPGGGKGLEILICLPIGANSWLPLARELADECGFIFCHDCMGQGEWEVRAYYLRDDGYILSMDEVREWLMQTVPGRYMEKPFSIADGFL